MFIDYENLVLQDYKNKKSIGGLSLRLTQPTPANLKKECMVICTNRLARKDERAFREFFEQWGDTSVCMQAIKHFDRDKFRPLVNFLKEGTASTEEKNIELLAWLIDFKDRPFVYGKKYNSDPPAIQVPPENPPDQDPIPQRELNPEPENNITAQPASVSSPKARPNLKARIAILTSIPLFLIAITTFWPRHSNAPTASLTNQGCMYWAGDHYEPIPCTKKLDGIIIVPLDSDRLNNFRKITIPDTITHRSKGKVYYIKINKKIEYYTAGGAYPLDFTLRVRPLTDYMIKKYIDSMRAE